MGVVQGMSGFWTSTSFEQKTAQRSYSHEVKITTGRNMFDHGSAGAMLPCKEQFGIFVFYDLFSAPPASEGRRWRLFCLQR